MNTVPISIQAGGDKVPTAPKRSLNILCIDDDEQVLEIMNACLSHFGHRVRVASGGKRGIELFRTAIMKSESYDAVITDMSMPDLDGDLVARAIKDESSKTPIIMMTAWGANVKNDAAIASTVDAVMSKPPHMQELNNLLLRMAC